MKFFPADWVRDTRVISLAAKGAWIDILCALWEAPKRGELTMSLDAWARLIGSNTETCGIIISELSKYNILLHVTERNSDVTLISRRILREENSRSSSRERVARFRDRVGNGECNAPVTPYILDTRSKIQETRYTKDKNNFSKRFQKPTASQIEEYAQTIDFSLDGSHFYDYYESKGWKIGNTPMKDWRAAVRTWKRNGNSRVAAEPARTSVLPNHVIREQERNHLEIEKQIAEEVTFNLDLQMAKLHPKFQEIEKEARKRLPTNINFGLDSILLPQKIVEVYKEKK